MCRQQTSKNQFFKELPLQKTKDIIYCSGERATFEFDHATKEFSSTPTAVIKKDRVEDFNVKGYCDTLKADIRISCNTETPCQVDTSKPQKTVRIKERTTFVFQWMRLDFTVAQLQQNSNLDYEVELEISDMHHLLQNQNQPELFKGIIRRFLQNVFSLANLMIIASKEIDAQAVRDKQRQIEMRQEAQKMEATARLKYQAQAGQAFSSYYGMEAKPICGDYLHSIALSKLNTNAAEFKPN